MTRRLHPRATGLLPAALLAYHHVGYPALLWAWTRVATAGPTHTLAGEPGTPSGRKALRSTELPPVAFVIAAHDEEGVIAAKVASTAALDYPRELIRIVVACDGCTDGTADAARAAGADLVLELPRGGKMAAQHAAVGEVDEPIVAFLRCQQHLGGRRAARARLRALGAGHGVRLRPRAVRAGRPPCRERPRRGPRRHRRR
ncbi:MAG: hypothetical protein PGN13_13130 [Patulibacter minatonensis]